MIKYLKYILATIGGFLVVAFTVIFVRNKVNDKYVDELINANNTDNKELGKEIKEIDKKEQTTEVSEAKIDQKLEDLKNEKIDDTEIANFIDLLEKKNEKN